MSAQPSHRTGLTRTAACFAIVLFGSPALAGDPVDRVLVSSTPDRTVLSYTIGDSSSQPVLIEGNEYVALSLEHHAYLWMDRAGHPQLPALHDSLMIPDDAAMGVTVLSADSYDIAGVDLAPWRGPISRTVDPRTVPYEFGPVYEQDAWFPSEVASLREPYILHDVRGVVLRVSPFQYNPVTRTLRVYTHIEVAVASTGPGQVNVIDRATYGHRPDRSFHALYLDQFVNYGALRAAPPLEDGDMLVISHGPFQATMQPLVDDKNARGIQTTMVDVASIGNNSTAIAAYIENVYNTSNLAFVLLVGDAAEISAPYFLGGRSDPSYSTITPDWYPDLFVGRFSAQTTAQVATQVQRTMEYESVEHDVTQGGWNGYGMGIASSEGAGIGHYGEADKAHEDLIRNELLGIGFTKVDQIYDWGATKAQITNGLNEGRRTVNYTGHGSVTSWGTTGYNNNDVNNLTNVGKLPFVCSVACVNGEYDAGTCFGEAWLQATYNGQPTGAVAAYMSSIDQYWAEPMYGQGNHGYGGKYAANEFFCMELRSTVGGVWFGGCCAMMDLAGTGGRDMFMTWILFGDPSLRLTGSATPTTLAVDNASVPINTPVDVTFTIQPGVDYANATYWLLCSASGSSPGFDLPYGPHVPLNWDAMTDLSLQYPTGWLFDNFYGTLDASGTGQAHFNTAGFTPIDRIYVGTQLYFSAVVWYPGSAYDLATNVKVLTLVP